MHIVLTQLYHYDTRLQNYYYLRTSSIGIIGSDTVLLSLTLTEMMKMVLEIKLSLHIPTMVFVAGSSRVRLQRQKKVLSEQHPLDGILSITPKVLEERLSGRDR